MRLQRDEIKAEHQVRGNTAEQLGIDSRFVKVEERTPIALSQTAAALALAVRVLHRRRCYIIAGSHKLTVSHRTALAGSSANGKREDWQV